MYRIEFRKIRLVNGKISAYFNDTILFKSYKKALEFHKNHNKKISSIESEIASPPIPEYYNNLDDVLVDAFESLKETLPIGNAKIIKKGETEKGTESVNNLGMYLKKIYTL